MRRQRSLEDFRKELDAHLALEADALRAEGVPDASALGVARRVLGNRTLIEEEFVERRGWRLWNELRRDIRYAVRAFARQKRLTAVLISTLALGVGANTALIGAIDEILWSPVKAPRGHELVSIQRVDRKTGRYLSASYPDYEDVARRATSLQGIAGYARAARELKIDNNEPMIVGSEGVTTNYFDVIEVRPVLGRAFLPADNAGPAGRAVVMLSEELWTSRFGRAADVIGRQLEVDDEPFEVIGVVSGAFGRSHDIGWGSPPDIWVPVATFTRFAVGRPGQPVLRSPKNELLQLFGRLAAGSTPRQVQAELDTIGSILGRGAHGGSEVGIEVRPAGEAKFYPGHRPSFGRQLALVGAAGVLVFVLACSNLASLLLERTTRRRRELALRASLGAGRARLVQQLLTESLVLVVPGFFVSLALAYVLLRLLSIYPTALGIPLAPDFHVTQRIVVLCLLTSVGAVLAFSVVPVSHATRIDLLAAASAHDALGEAPRRLRHVHALVVAQIAVSAALLAGSLVILRAVHEAQRVELGYQTDRLIGLSINRAGRQNHQLPASAFDLRRWHIGGIEGVAVASERPLGGTRAAGQISDRASMATEPIACDVLWVTSRFFDVLSIPVLLGRSFSAADAQGSTVVVNQALADRLWPGEHPIGRIIQGAHGTAPSEVVGVVADTRYLNLWESRRPTVYRQLEVGDPRAREILIRMSVPPRSILPNVEQAWRAMSPNTRLAGRRAGADHLWQATRSQRVTGLLIIAFAAIALLVAAIGLYSAMAWLVEQRRREIAVRVAVGGSPATIARIVVGRAAAMMVAGATLGLSVVFALAPRIAVVSRSANPYDSAAFAGAAATLALVSFAAASIPAVRAVRIDPAQVLKSD